jgi:hypothetical protein
MPNDVFFLCNSPGTLGVEDHAGVRDGEFDR